MKNNMKKIIVLVFLVMSGIFIIPTSAQTVYHSQDIHKTRQDNENRERRERRNRRWIENRRYNDVYVVNEQRYIRVGRKVYREIYESTYTRRGLLVNRLLVNRQRIARYQQYDNNGYQKEGVRFNVFLRF